MQIATEPRPHKPCVKCDAVMIVIVDVLTDAVSWLLDAQEAMQIEQFGFELVATVWGNGDL